jgi:hypothetical protein
MANAQGKKQGKGKRYGRNAIKCRAYQSAGTRERNKRRRIARDELRHNAQRRADSAGRKAFREYQREIARHAIADELAMNELRIAHDFEMAQAAMR